MQTQTRNCNVCGMKFEVTCFSELQEKLKKHKCVKVNKRAKRTAEVQQAQTNQFVQDVATDRIHQHRFDKLVKRGVLVRG